jgi:hypothetical protein
MAKQNAINLDVTPESDGFKIAGGTTSREIKISGGNVELQGSGSAEISIPISSGSDEFVLKAHHKASSAEINAGTEDNKYITPDALAGSNFGTKTVQQYCVEWGTELAVKDGVGYIEIPAELNGMNLISARARVGTAGTTNASTFDIYNVTDSTSMLSSAISIASGATSGTGTVDTDHDDVATGDIIRIDVDTLSTTKPKGLIITLAFRLA